MRVGEKVLELARTKIGQGYIWGAQGELITPEKLEWFKRVFGASHYDFNDGYGKVSASKWIGKEGYDCSGLIVWALREMGTIPKTADYNANTFLNSLCNQITKAELQVGDLVFIGSAKNKITHVGIYAGNGKTVEAKGTRWGVVEDTVTRYNYFGRLKYADIANPKPEVKPEAPAKPFEPIRVQITADALNVREGAGTNCKVVSYYKKDDVVTVTDSKNGWYKTTKGWFSEKYAKVVENKKVQITAWVLNIRKGAGTSYGIAGFYTKDKVVEVLDEKDGWLRTDRGWISTKYTMTV